jgi:hypothetical protein
MLLLQQMHQQQQQLGMVPPGMQGSMPSIPGAAAVPVQPALGRTRSPSGSDDTVESASEILVRLGLLQQARGEQEQLQQEALEQEALEQEALAAYMAEEQDLQGLSTDSMWASAAWSIPMPVALPAVQSVRAYKTAPLNVIQLESLEAAGCGPLTPTAATAAATRTVEDLTGLVAHQHLAAHERRASFEQSLHPGAAGPAAVAAAAAAAGLAAAGAAADVAAQAGAVLAEAGGLRQRRPAATPTGGSLFSKQRRLSWEEEQPEPVPLAPSFSAAPYQRPAAAAAAAAAGWYPGTWQLPEPSNSLLLGQGGYVRGQGVSHVQPPRPDSAAVIDPAGGELCSYGGLTGYLAGDPFTEPSYAGEVSGTLLQRRQQLQQHEAEAQQQQHWLQQQQQQQQEDDVQNLLEQQQEDVLQQQQQQQQEENVLQQQQWVQQQQVNEEVEELQQQQWLEQQQHKEEQAGVQQTRGASCQAGPEQASTAALEFEPVSCGKGVNIKFADCSKHSSSSKSGVNSDVCCSSSSSSSSSNLPQSPVGGLSLQRPWQLLAVSACGFQDPCLEASYLVFKNHGCSMLDATAGFICTSMLLTSTLRSLNLRSDYIAWLQLMTMAIYAVLFFLPYIVMKLQLQTFLRLREQLLVFGRNMGAIVLAAMALGYLPMVQVWKNVIVSSLSLQIQNGFILPACQQVRLPAALMIAAVHIPADAIWLAVGRPFRWALLHSVLMQLSSVTVALMFDVWCRVRFVHRYSGMTAGGQRSAPPLQQS